MPAMFGRRPDGTLAKVHPYRRAMPFIMSGRNESAVYFEQTVDITKTEAFIAAFNEVHPETRITLFHVVLWAAIQTLHEPLSWDACTSRGTEWASEKLATWRGETWKLSGIASGSRGS